MGTLLTLVDSGPQAQLPNRQSPHFKRLWGVNVQPIVIDGGALNGHIVGFQAIYAGLGDAPHEWVEQATAACHAALLAWRGAPATFWVTASSALAREADCSSRNVVAESIR